MMVRPHNKTLMRLLTTLANLMDAGSTGLRSIEIMKLNHMVPEDCKKLNESQRRAFERLKVLLRDFGFPLQQEDGRYWINHRKHLLKDPHLTTEEQFFLRYLASSIARNPDYPLRTNLANCLSRLSAFPSVNASYFLEHWEADAVQPADQTKSPTQSGNTQYLERMIQASQQKIAVKFKYYSFHSISHRMRYLEPYGYFCKRGDWYVVGRDIPNEAVKVFRLSRIQSMPETLTEHYFTVPEDFSVKQYANVMPWNFDQSSSCPARVVVALASSELWRIRAICENNGQLEPTDDPAWHHWIVDVYNIDPLIRWLFPLGVDAQPVEPPQFVERYHEIVTEVLEQYAKG